MAVEHGTFVPVGDYLMNFKTKKAFVEYEKRTDAVVVDYVREFFGEDASSAKQWLGRSDTPNYAIVGDDTVVGFARNYDDATLMCEGIVAATPYYSEVRLFSRNGLVECCCYDRRHIQHCHSNHLYHWAKGEAYVESNVDEVVK